MRFRKGKKAYKLGKKNKSSGRYLSYLIRLEARRRLAGKIALASLSAIMGVVQMARINSSIYHSPQEKAFALVNVSIDTAFAVQKAFI